MFGLGMGEMIAIGAVCVVVFGAKRFPEIGSSVAKGIKNFQKGMTDSARLEDESTSEDSKSESEKKEE